MLIPAVCAFALCVLFLSRPIGLRGAVAASIIKVGICACYLLWVGNSGFRLFDDRTYFENAASILQQGYNPVSVLTTPDGLSTLFSTVGGEHVGYTWWNVLLFWVFGAAYFVPLFFNVAISCIAAWAAASIALSAGFSRKYAGALALFFALHWDVLVWSSILNLKDTITFTLALVAINGFVQIRNARFGALKFWINAASVALALGALQYFRFYLPPILLASACVWLFLGGMPTWAGPPMRLALLCVFALGFAAMAFRAPLSSASGTISGTNAAEGFVRILLTPQPWSIEPNYGFLLLPSLLHWLMLVPAVFGILRLNQISVEARLLTVYSLLCLSAFAVSDALIGPRQRLVVCPLLIWGQFHALVMFVERIELRYQSREAAAS